MSNIVPKWKFKVYGSINTSPAVSDGVVYCGNRDGRGLEKYHLYAVDAKTGAEQWKFPTNQDNRFSLRSPTVSDGIVYVGSYDKHLYALDAKTGKEQWKFETGGSVESPTVSDGIVYVGGYDNHLYAVDAKTGKEQWKFETGSWIQSSPTVSDGLICFGNYDKHLYALDAKTGKEQWKFETGSWINDTTISPTVLDGIVYCGNDDNHLYALDAKTGKEQWKFETGGSVTSSPTVSDGIVYVGSYDGHLYALDAKTGAEQWKFETDDEISTIPAVSDGIVYFGSWDHLYAVDIRLALLGVKELESKKQETGNEIRVQDIIDALWEEFQPESPNSLLQQEYETEAKHFEVDYMLNETTIGSDGVERLGSDPDCDGYCYLVVTGDIDEDCSYLPKKDIAKIEKIKVSVWYYIVDNYESDFFNYINSDGLSLGLQSKDDIESEINEMIKSLCDLFSGFTIMGAEDLYPEKGDNPWKNPETIYLQVSAEEISLEDLNPDWNNEEFKLVE